MTDAIHTIADLEACLGPVSLGAQMKQIDYLDEGAKRWMAASPLAFVGTAGSNGLALTLAGGRVGFATASEAGELVLPASVLDDPAAFAEGAGAGILLLIPGITETMRVNGRVVSIGADIRLAVEEVYIHCGKALIRSDFWAAAPVAHRADDTGKFLADTRFIALATADASGRVDVSPKGDPTGAMVHLAGHQAVFADRPGNRRADGFRNIIDRPEAVALAIVPGSAQIAVLSGQVALTRDPDACAPFTVDGKVPQLVTRMDGPAPVLRDSPALSRAGLWPSASVSRDDVDPSVILVGHIKLNKAKGEQADFIRGVVEADVVRNDLALAYKHTLY